MAPSRHRHSDLPAGANPSPAIDIVIPTFQGRDELVGCLGSLAAVGNGPIRALVCVDGSTDETPEVIRATPFPFEVVVLEHADRANHGRAAARNLALPHLRSEVVLLLDSDMRLAPEAIERHLAVLARPGVVSVGDVVYENAATNVWAGYLATRGKNKYAPASRIRPLDFATGNTALRSADLQAVGGFDDGFTGYGGEDTDLGLRLAERGLSFVFNAEAFATTVERKTVDEGLRQLDAFARTNLRRIRWAHPSGPAPYWLDRLESRRLRDRLMRALMNPMTDAVVRVVEPVAPFALRRRLLDYHVLRTVWRGYVEGQR